jgi:hypothetical protein
MNAMTTMRSEKVRKILQLEGRAASLLASYESTLARIAPSRHRAEQLVQEARALKVTLTGCELRQLRRARSGV